jgi:hypothetical protein
MNKTYNGHVNVKHRICIYHTACITVRVALQRVKVNFFYCQFETHDTIMRLRFGAAVGSCKAAATRAK